MLRHPGLIAVSACIAASVACDGGNFVPDPPLPDPITAVTVEFGGRVVNADAGDPVGNVEVSLTGIIFPPGPGGWFRPNNPATSGADGTFTLPLNLPSSWRSVILQLAGPGYDYRQQRFEATTAADRPAIKMYPTLVIRPGESITVRVDTGISLCGESSVDMVDCRRVLMAASPGDPVELELVSDDSSMPMALTPEEPNFGADMSVRRLMVPPGGIPYVVGVGTARLTARR